MTTVARDKGFGSNSLNNGAKVWVQWPKGPPNPAEGTAVGKGNTV